MLQTEVAYKLAMHEIDTLMKKGEDNLTTTEITTLNTLATKAEQYEDTFHPMQFREPLP